MVVFIYVLIIIFPIKNGMTDNISVSKKSNITIPNTVAIFGFSMSSAKAIFPTDAAMKIRHAKGINQSLRSYCLYFFIDDNSNIFLLTLMLCSPAISNHIK